ncbi:MAG: GHMP kinase [Candidatus Omnitrophica bacterium]|nr:GHMP kinase [Candidatus Omnitrophota bacterium]
MIISRTPMRVSFAGGGTDFENYYRNGSGAVVSTAVDKYIYITVNKKFDDLIRVSYSSTEIVDSVDKIEHNIIRESLKLVGIDKGIDIVYMGDVPLGSAGVGLGSSSSLAVGVLNALYAYTGRYASPQKLAEDACRIEIDILGHPIGKQDQYAAAYGGFNYIQFNHDDSIFVDPVICPRELKETLNNRLMLFYTGVTRVSSTILEKQNKNIPEKTRYLDRLVALAKELRMAIVNNDLDAFADILNECWKNKVQLADGITNDEIDTMYKKALKAGARGGKLLGAGGGGFLLLYCEEKYQDNLRLTFAGFKESRFNFESQGSKIIYISDCDVSWKRSEVKV